jgi:hypothetical protein
MQNLFIWLLVVSSCSYRIPPQKFSHEPVCLPAAEVRASFAVEPPHPIGVFGKISLHRTLLLVSEPYKGIHFFDNADPTQPKPLGFLRILGNTDMAMSGDMLYANSSTDLLTVRLADQQAELVGREEDTLTVITPADLVNGFAAVSRQSIAHCKAQGGMVVGFRTKIDGSVTQKKIEENRRD